MMKQVSLVFISFFISTVSFAQLNAIMVNDSSFIWGDVTDIDLVVDKVFLNYLLPTNPEDVQRTSLYYPRKTLRWVRTESLPTGWQSLVCDAESCKGAEDDSFQYLQPMGPGLLIVHFIPNGIMGEGSVSLKVKDTENGSFIIATYFCKVSAVGIKEVSVSGELKIFPNPLRTQIKFANIGNYDVSSIEIFDLLGQRIMSFKASNKRNSYSVDNLRAGMYFVRLLDKNKTPLITKKFNKQ